MYCCVYSIRAPDDGQRNCPKHVEFYSKNKFEKLVHLVGFIIRIYHDARSSECQICHILINTSIMPINFCVTYGYTLDETDVIKYKLMSVVPNGRLRRQFQCQKCYYTLR